MTQYELIKQYICEYGSIVPAKVGGSEYKGGFFGSETSKRCRELRADKVLTSVKEGKFQKYFLVDQDVKEERLPPCLGGFPCESCKNIFIEQTEKLPL